MRLADKTVAVPCPHCKAKLQVRLGELSPGNSLRCGCGANIKISGDSDPSAAVKRLDAALGKLGRKR